jgi:simple sugar transport system ATP-binding protein
VIVSTELDEVVALSDRIAVMYRGKIVDIVSPETTREDLGLLMAGILPGTGTGITDSGTTGTDSGTTGTDSGVTDAGTGSTSTPAPAAGTEETD